jgi:hypothetical protein
MSKIAELAYDIEQLFIEGLHPTKIAKQLEIPLPAVYDWIETNGCEAEADPWAEIDDPHVVDIDEVYSPYHGA